MTEVERNVMQQLVKENKQLKSEIEALRDEPPVCRALPGRYIFALVFGLMVGTIIGQWLVAWWR